MISPQIRFTVGSFSFIISNHWFFKDKIYYVLFNLSFASLPSGDKELWIDILGNSLLITKRQNA